MKITNTIHRQQIKKEFLKLLIEHGFSLRSFCQIHGDSSLYTKLHGNLNRYSSTDLLFIQSMIEKVDKSKKVFLQNGKFVIAKPI